MGTFLCLLVAPAQYKPCGVPAGTRRSRRPSPGLAGEASRDAGSSAAVLARFPPGCGRGASMRSEREAGPGPGRGGGRDTRPMDAPLLQESPRRDTDALPNPAPPPSPPSSLPPPPHPAPGKQREEKKTALSKVRGRERGERGGGGSGDRRGWREAAVRRQSEPDLRRFVCL